MKQEFANSGPGSDKNSFSKCISGMILPMQWITQTDQIEHGDLHTSKSWKGQYHSHDKAYVSGIQGENWMGWSSQVNCLLIIEFHRYLRQHCLPKNTSRAQSLENFNYALLTVDNQQSAQNLIQLTLNRARLLCVVSELPGASSRVDYTLEKRNRDSIVIPKYLDQYQINVVRRKEKHTHTHNHTSHIPKYTWWIVCIKIYKSWVLNVYRDTFLDLSTIDLFLITNFA